MIPDGIGVIDLMMGTRAGPAAQSQYGFMRRGLKDEGSKGMNFPAQYMFRDVPYSDQARDADRQPKEEPASGAALLLPHMDRHGVERAMIGVGPDHSEAQACLTDHPDRFFGSYQVDPNRGMEGVRELVQMHDEWGIKAATAFPAGYLPQVPIADRRMYPFYAKCVELDIPICIGAGVPGPRLPMDCQKVEQLDEVCYDFPELRIVTRHGCEPWTELAVKLMLKWPNLYYSTSAFAPKYYPRDVIDYANTRGAEKVLYAGYFPMGLSLDRIFSELPDVPLREDVWPKFLRDNALRVFGLEGAAA